MSERPLCTTRREFLTGGLTCLSTASVLPVLLGNTARVLAGPEPLTRQKSGSDRILVMVQLAGGNDGLNTVIPYENDLYYKCRRRIAIAKKDVLPLENGLGLHPAARGLKELYDDGKLAIVQGVGYPNHSRNHFASTLIWQTGDAGRHFGGGWLGRLMDVGGRGSCRATLAERSAGASPSQPGRRRSFNADIAWKGVRAGRLARSLGLVARLIAADRPMRVYYVSMGGFDTHTRQAARHQRLLAEFGDAMKSFVDRLKADRLLDRVLVVTFSEFGRRVQENAGGGTDHGEAAPMFLIGSKLRPGIHEKHPSLATLHRGALIPGCDFRRVYADILCRWLGMNPQKVLGPGFTPLRLIKE